MKKTGLASLLIISALFAIVTVSQAAVPQMINYQGYLTNPSGSPLTGTYQMVFSLCDAASGGTCPWSESQSVAVDKGIFNVALGAVVPITLTFSAPYFLDIQVNGEQMSARQPLTSVGYAFRADTAGQAATAATATNFTGSISGDVTGTQGATVVGSVGGRTAAQIVSGTDAANSAIPANTANTLVRRDASGNFSAGTITANLTGTAVNVTGTVAVANGGTGATTVAAALNNLLPSQTGNSGKVLSTNGSGTTSWISAGGGADSTPPVLGSSGTITATNSGTDIILSWAAATDNVTPQSNLEYTVFYSKSNNVNTVTNAEANGTAFGLPWASNITTKTVAGLTVGTTYYFNVAVKDAGLNKAMYTTVSKAPSVPASDIILYLAGTTYNGNLSGRSGANAKCSASANKPVGYSNVAAFISVNSSDTIAGRQTFSGLSTSTAIRSTNGTLIANNWADLLDGTIANTLVSAGINVGGNGWNSGSNVDGTLGDTCNGWTVGTASSGYLGDWGSGTSITATWIYNSTSKDGCAYLGDILCIAW